MPRSAFADIARVPMPDPDLGHRGIAGRNDRKRETADRIDDTGKITEDRYTLINILTSSVYFY